MDKENRVVICDLSRIDIRPYDLVEIIDNFAVARGVRCLSKNCLYHLLPDQCGFKLVYLNKGICPYYKEVKDKNIIYRKDLPKNFPPYTGED